MASTEVSINQLPTITNIEAGNFVIVQTENATNKLDFKDFVVGLENTTFANTLSTATTNVDVLSTAFPSMSQGILRSNDTVTGADDTLVDVEVSSIKLATSVNLLKADSFVKIKCGLTVSLSSGVAAAAVFQVSTDGVSYTEIDSTKYSNSTPNNNVNGTFIISDGTTNNTNPTSEGYEILYQPTAVGDNNAFYVKVSLRSKTGTSININRGTGSGNKQKGAGISYITLEEVFNNGNQSVNILA